MVDSHGTIQRSFWGALWKQTTDSLYRLESPVTQWYEIPWLGILGKLIWIAAPIYWIVEFTTTSSYYSAVDTTSFFTSSCSTGYVYINDSTFVDGYIQLHSIGDTKWR